MIGLALLFASKFNQGMYITIRELRPIHLFDEASNRINGHPSIVCEDFERHFKDAILMNRLHNKHKSCMQIMFDHIIPSSPISPWNERKIQNRLKLYFRCQQMISSPSSNHQKINQCQILNKILEVMTQKFFGYYLKETL
jgi:hypothetical protein